MSVRGRCAQPEHAERELRPADRFPFRIDEADARQAQGERQAPCRRHHQQRQVRDELELLRRMRLRRAVRCAREGVRVDDDVTVHVVRVGEQRDAALVPREEGQKQRRTYISSVSAHEQVRRSAQRYGIPANLPTPNRAFCGNTSYRLFPEIAFPRSSFGCRLPGFSFPESPAGAFGPFSALFSRFCG